MKLRIDEIPSDGGLSLAGTLAPPRDPQPGQGPALRSPIAFAVLASRDGDVLRVNGWVHTVARVECARCLEPVRLVVDRALRVEAQPARRAPSEPETELDAADLDIEYYGEDGLDLRSVLAAQVLLGLPMKVLCTQECRGLCPQCGVDRNRQSCECRPAVDPRLAALIELRDRL